MILDLNNAYNEKGPGRYRQRGSSRQKLARRSVVPRLKMKGNQQPPKKDLILLVQIVLYVSSAVITFLAL